MTLRNFALIALVDLAVSSNAETVPFPADGDLFMGFRSTTASNEYLWDIGQYTASSMVNPWDIMLRWLISRPI
jgi:hypothetical protein